MPSIRLAALGIAPLLVAGCAPLITGTSAPRVAEAIGHVKPSKADTCETQRQIAAQSSRIDTIIKGRETVYKADCKEPAVNG